MRSLINCHSGQRSAFNPESHRQARKQSPGTGMIVLLIFILFSLPARAEDQDRKYQECLSLAEANPATAYDEAMDWASFGGGIFAQHCAGMAQLGKGEYKQAAMRLEYVAKEISKFKHDATKDDQVDILRQAAKSWLANKDFKDAIRVLNDALVLMPDNPDILHDRANVQVEQGHFWPAIDDLNKLIDENHESLEIYTLRGKAYRLLQTYDLAETDIEQALRLNKNYAPALLELGFIYEAKKDLDKARDAFLAASLADPGSSIADRAQMEFQKLIPEIQPETKKK